MNGDDVNPQGKDITLERKTIEGMIQALATASGVTQATPKQAQPEKPKQPAGPEKPKVQDSLAGTPEQSTFDISMIHDLGRIESDISQSLGIRATEAESNKQFVDNTTSLLKQGMDPNALGQPYAAKLEGIKSLDEYNQQRREEIMDSSEYTFADTLQKIGMVAAAIAMPVGAPGLMAAGLIMGGTGKRIKDEAMEGWRVSAEKMQSRYLETSGTGIERSVEQRSQDAFLEDMRFAITANNGEPLSPERVRSMAAMRNVPTAWALSINQANIPTNPEDIKQLKESDRLTGQADADVRKLYREKITGGDFTEAAQKSKRLNDPSFLEDEIKTTLGEGWQKALNVTVSDVAEAIAATDETITSVQARDRRKTRAGDVMRHEQRTPFTDMIGNIAGMAHSDLVEITGEEKERFPVLRKLESSESLKSQANVFLETLEEDGHWERRNDGWMFTVPTKYEDVVNYNRQAIKWSALPIPVTAKTGHIPLLDKVWKQEKQPTIDQMLTALDAEGFSKEARAHFGAMIMAMR